MTAGCPLGVAASRSGGATPDGAALLAVIPGRSTSDRPIGFAAVFAVITATEVTATIPSQYAHRSRVALAPPHDVIGAASAPLADDPVHCRDPPLTTREARASRSSCTSSDAGLASTHDAFGTTSTPLSDHLCGP